MSEFHPDTGRPTQVRIAVALIALAALIGVADELSRSWGSWDPSRWSVRWMALETAVWALLALSVYLGRHWARVTVGVLTVLSLFVVYGFVRRITEGVPTALDLRLIEVLLRVAAVIFLFGKRTEWFFRPPTGVAPRPWAFPATFAAVLAVQIAFIIAVSYFLAKADATGNWDFLFAIPFMFASVVLAIVFCFLKNVRWRWVAKVVVVLLAATTPFIGRALLPITTPLVAYKLKPGRHDNFASFMREWREEQRKYAQIDAENARQRELFEVSEQRSVEMERIQTAELKELFKSAQNVRAAGERFLILDNDHCIVIYGIDTAPERTAAFKAYAQDHIVGRTVDIRLPHNHPGIYIPGKNGRLWSGLTYGEPRDRRGDLFGDVQALVFVDGRLINLDYCRGRYRESLVTYQDAYSRGDF